jgi:hypothetical protein
MSEYASRWVSLSGRVRWQARSLGVGHKPVYPNSLPKLYRSRKVAEFIGKKRERKVQRKTYMRGTAVNYSDIVIDPKATAEGISPPFEATLNCLCAPSERCEGKY